MRLDQERTAEDRSSALWTKGERERTADSERGNVRSSALWGKGGRGFVALVALVFVLAAPPAALAEDYDASVPKGLRDRAEKNPSATFSVIVQGNGIKAGKVAERAKNEGGKVHRKLSSVNGVAVNLSGKALLKLAERGDILAITPDAPVSSTYQNAEMWREEVRVDALWAALDPLTGLLAAGPQAPTIAIVDSGVDATKLDDFGGRLLANVNVSTLAPGATGDGQGHGTLVAGIAAGSSPAHMGAAPNAPLVSIRTSDDDGRSITSDVIAAADWILANKDAYGIRVANFSLAGSVETSFRFDPLDKAVERLWFNGVVVVAAAGNHGAADGSNVSMSYAPGNDPFIITVGALDPAGSSDPYDDSVPWWSGKGYTMDGFYKPDMAAPGRYMVGPVPAGASMAAHAPDRVLAPGYMWMSGTSFAAPVVAGAAAQLLARHPDWGPDEVKGALMLSSAYLGLEGSGVGVIDALSAASLDFTPPNPNEGFYPFVEVDEATGYRYFNAANWAKYVETAANWAQANWAAAAWASANWAQANWAQAAWSSANWAQNVESSMTTTASWNASANAE